MVVYYKEKDRGREPEKGLGEIAGIVFRQDGYTVRTKKREPLKMDLLQKKLQFFFYCLHLPETHFFINRGQAITALERIAGDRLEDGELEILSQMRPGLVQLEMGVQSANPLTLQAVQRNMDIERLKKTVEHIRKGGNVHIHLDLIAGRPYENYESFGKSFNVVYEMKPEQSPSCFPP